MNPVIFIASGDGAWETIRQVTETFGLDLPQFLSQLISFSIVAFLLHRFAYKPLLEVLDERRKTIAESLENAEKIKAEVAKTEAARLEILQKANAQANELIMEARAAAAKVQQTETQKAIAAAEQLIAKAREAIAADRERTMAELRHEIGRLVVETTAKVAGKVLTPEDQKRILEETTKSIDTQ